MENVPTGTGAKTLNISGEKLVTKTTGTLVIMV